MIPGTAISFLCHFIVLVDDVFSLKDCYNRLAGFLGSLTSDVTNTDIEDSVVTDLCKFYNFSKNQTSLIFCQIWLLMTTLIKEMEPPYNPSHGVNHHAEFISLSTGFMTLCLFNLLVLLISFITTLLDVFNLTGPSLSILVALAITPIVWITRNKKMKETLIKLFNVDK